MSYIVAFSLKKKRNVNNASSLLMYLTRGGPIFFLKHFCLSVELRSVVFVCLFVVVVAFLFPSSTFSTIEIQ